MPFVQEGVLTRQNPVLPVTTIFAHIMAVSAAVAVLLSVSQIVKRANTVITLRINTIVPIATFPVLKERFYARNVARRVSSVKGISLMRE